MITNVNKATDADLDGLVELVWYEGSRGMVSADITRLHGTNLRPLLVKLEKKGRLKSRPTNRRDMGTRWFAPEFYPGP